MTKVIALVLWRKTIETMPNSLLKVFKDSQEVSQYPGGYVYKYIHQLIGG